MPVCPRAGPRADVVRHGRLRPFPAQPVIGPAFTPGSDGVKRRCISFFTLSAPLAGLLFFLLGDPLEPIAHLAAGVVLALIANVLLHPLQIPRPKAHGSRRGTLQTLQEARERA